MSINVNMTTPEGVTLATAGKYCEDDITVVPTFEIGGGGVDLSGDTVTPATLLEGITAHNAQGNPIVGTQRAKAWIVNVPTAVARVYTTLVSGDSDVAAHYADRNAVCVVLKITNNASNGLYTVITRNRPSSMPTNTDTNIVFGWDAAGSVAAVASKPTTLTDERAASVYGITATSAGEIKIMAGATKTNFGGADYLVIFGW